MRIYVASSWRNERQPEVVKALRSKGYDVYDFRSPRPGNRGFHWSDIDPEWQLWGPRRFREALQHPIAKEGFALDMEALTDADVVILVMPCGRSAHLEFGHAIGRGAHGAILLADGEPELMYGMADLLAPTLDEIIQWLGFTNAT